MCYLCINSGGSITRQGRTSVSMGVCLCDHSFPRVSEYLHGFSHRTPSESMIMDHHFNFYYPHISRHPSLAACSLEREIVHRHAKSRLRKTHQHESEGDEFTSLHNLSLLGRTVIPRPTAPSRSRCSIFTPVGFYQRSTFRRKEHASNGRKKSANLQCWTTHTPPRMSKHFEARVTSPTAIDSLSHTVASGKVAT